MIAFKTEMLAECLGITPRRVRQLRNEGVLREVRQGLYEPGENVRAYIEYVKKGSGAQDVDYYTERAGLTRAKRRSEEAELAEAEGRLHAAEDVEKIVGDMLIKFRSKMMAIPSNACGEVLRMEKKEDIYEVLKRHIDEALEELSDYDKLFGKE